MGAQWIWQCGGRLLGGIASVLCACVLCTCLMGVGGERIVAQACEHGFVEQQYVTVGTQRRRCV